MSKKYSDQEFIDAWKRLGSPSSVSKELGLNLRGVNARRDSLERKYGIILETISQPAKRVKIEVPTKGFRALKENVVGSVIIGSDGHFWPGERSRAFAAMIEIIKDLQPSMVIMNGDSFDGAKISRYPPSARVQTPSVAEELEAVKERHAEIEAYAPPGCYLMWTDGNHDNRFMARLAQAAPEYIQVQGFDIADHFPAWQFCTSLWLNEHTVVKHRIHQGVHGAYNNTLKSGKSIVTGHTHRLQATMFADYNGLRWGVECGTLSDYGPENDKFAYAEDNPVNWSQGFVVLHFAPSGMLLEPEFCRVLDGTAYFRGQVVISREGSVKTIPQKKTKQKKST